MCGCIVLLAFIISLIFLLFGPFETKGAAFIVFIITSIMMWIYRKLCLNEEPVVSSQTQFAPNPAPKPTPQAASQPVDSQLISINYDISDDDILNENVEFKDDAIYFKRKKWDGVKWTIERQKVYVYKRSYHLDMGGGPPRFHICRCCTIDSFIRQGRLKEYRKSDKDFVWVRNLDFHDSETQISHLPLCLNCYNKMKSQYRWLDSETDNQDFVRRVIKKTYWA